MRIAAVIVAAGRGLRAGNGLPKQYRKLNGEIILETTLKAFTSHALIDEIIVVIHPDDQHLFNAIAKDLSVRSVFGGATRTASVRAGLHALVDHEIDAVLVHDGARPYVSEGLIDRLIECLDDFQAAVPALPVTDATYLVHSDRLDRVLDRSLLRHVQTPQAFSFSTLNDLINNLNPDDALFDEASLLLDAGIKVKMVDGDPANMKVTFPSDFGDEKPLKVTVSGQGFDVHRLQSGNGLRLCGINIPCSYELVGHSDADVGLHALTDALLGAIGEGDIGQHFPPSDNRWKGASSARFVQHALKLAEGAGTKPIHADLTIICEQPKIGPYRDAMRTAVAALLDLPLTSVNIKATTTERLGFTGRGEGIAAQALVTVIKS